MVKEKSLKNDLQARFAKLKDRSRYLHSPNHLLADELSQKLNEPGRFGFYLRMAIKYNHSYLRGIASKVLESKAKKPGALFAYLVKKESQSNDSVDHKSSQPAS